MPDAYKNFAYSLVATAPSPPATGTSLVVTAGQGSRFPVTPFNATVWPAGAQPDVSNAEIVRVTAISTDTFTITRAQEGSAARGIVVGDQIAATITSKSLTDLAPVLPIVTQKKGSGAGNYTTTSATYVDMDATNLALVVTVETGNKMMIWVHCSGQHDTSSHSITVALTDATTVLAEVEITAPTAGTRGTFLIAYVFVGDGASHTFKIRWKTSSATASMHNSSATFTPMMHFMELPAS